jgi:hypothetical protein
MTMKTKRTEIRERILPVLFDKLPNIIQTNLEKGWFQMNLNVVRVKSLLQ